jgi:hypothetical protein
MEKNVLATAIALTVCLGSAQAAEKIRYEEIPGHLGPFGSVLAYRGFKVVTLDGKAHRGRRLGLGADHLQVFHSGDSYERLPAEQVLRIEIRQGGRYFQHVVESVGLPLSPILICSDGFPIAGGRISPACAIPMAIIFSPLWTYPAVVSPFYLVADGIAWLIPPKVYEIVH